MLRWILLLTIALLPLRGWVGDAMAGEWAKQMGAVQEVTAPHEAASPGHLSAVTSHDHMGHDCMDDVQAQGEDDDTAATQDPSCPTCSNCQACSAVAMASTPAMALSDSFDGSRPAAAIAHFASADRAPDFKPPIS